MKFGKIEKVILAVVAFVVMISIILFVHGAHSEADILVNSLSPLEQLSQKIGEFKESHPELVVAGQCKKLDEYVESVKPVAGRPMLDISFGWELQRRMLDMQCKLERFFAKTVADLSRLEQELDAAHDALKKERSNHS
jgi:hypothetical protein